MILCLFSDVIILINFGFTRSLAGNYHSRIQDGNTYQIMVNIETCLDILKIFSNLFSGTASAIIFMQRAVFEDSTFVSWSI
jgi:hypothetical protein